MLWSSPKILGVCSGKIWDNSSINITISNIDQCPQNAGAKNDIVLFKIELRTRIVLSYHNPMVKIC